MDRDSSDSPPPPPPPLPPSSFPVPFARQRSTEHTRNSAGTSTYIQAGPPPGNNHPSPVPSHGGYTSSQLYTSTQPLPTQPPPVRKSTRPHSNVAAPAHAPAPAPTPAFTNRPAPSYEYEYAPHFPAPQMTGSISHRSTISDPSGPSIPARLPFTGTGTGTTASGSRPQQPLTTMPVPVLSNTAPSVPYHPGSSHSNTVYPSPQSGGPPPNSQEWSYLDQYERDVSSDSGDEDFAQSPESRSDSSRYMRQKSPPDPPFAGRRRRSKRRETVPASSSQAPLELERCRLCGFRGPRHEWARLGHRGFCSEKHKWQWEHTYVVQK